MTQLTSDPETPTGPRIALLAEDSVVNQKLLIYMLKNEGFDVVLAENGQDAVDLFKERAFDVVVMDVHMPVMDGLESTRLMQQHQAESQHPTPIIAVTAAMDRGSCMAAGMDAYLEKPVRAPDFHDVLSQVCPRRRE